MVIGARRGADRESSLTPAGEGVANGQTPAGAPNVEAGGQEDNSEKARDRESKRAGLLLVIVGVVLMTLAATEAAATGDGAPDTPASTGDETRLESAG